MDRVREVETRPDRIDSDDFDKTAGQGVVAEYQAEQPLALRSGVRIFLSLLAGTTYTSAGNGEETFDLPRGYTDSGATPEPVIVSEYAGQNQFAQDALVSVDPGDGTITLDDGGTVAQYGILYAPSDQAEVTLRKSGPKGRYEDLVTWDLALIHARDHSERPLTAAYDASPLQPVIPKKWSLQVLVDGYDIAYEAAYQPSPSDSHLLSFPVRRAVEQIDGLGTAVGQDSATR